MMEKRFIHQDTIYLGNISLKQRHELTSIDEREKFYLDVWRGGLNLGKYTQQNRARKICILVRIDIGGSPHLNPDQSIIQCPHIHLYKEGFDDKWAYPLDNYIVVNTNDIVETFIQFSSYCNVKNIPPCQYKHA